MTLFKIKSLKLSITKSPFGHEISVRTKDSFTNIRLDYYQQHDTPRDPPISQRSSPGRT